MIKHLLLSDYFLLSVNFLFCLKCNFLLLNLLTTNLKNATPSTEFQVSWHGRRWLKELGDPEKGFYGWVSPAFLPMSFFLPYSASPFFSKLGVLLSVSLTTLTVFMLCLFTFPFFSSYF